MTVTVSLTDYMSIETFRGNMSKLIEFKDGVPKEHPAKKLKNEMHGLSTTIIPSEKYLGKINLTYDLVEDYLRTMSYILPPFIETHYYREDEKGKTYNHIKYKCEGLSACTKYLSSSLETNPIDIRVETDKFDLEVAFSYDKTTNDIVCQSFANAIITREGGNHEIACQRAICDFFTREAKKMDPTHKLEVAYDDCKRGLVMAVNCDHSAPQLEGNAKSKLANVDVLKEGKTLIQQALQKYFNNDPALLRKIIGYLRQMAKIRLESNKIKGISTKKASTFLDDAEIKKYYPIANRNFKGTTELFISEG